MPKLHTYSLEQLENDIDEYIREHDAAMIYCHHQQDIFVFYGSSDTALFKEEMKILIKHIKMGNIVNVNKGLVVDVKGTQLYPVELEFRAAQCEAYFLVAKRGLTDHIYMTPYFFRSERKRDEIFDCLIKKGKSVKK